MLWQTEKHTQPQGLRNGSCLNIAGRTAASSMFRPEDNQYPTGRWRG